MLQELWIPFPDHMLLKQVFTVPNNLSPWYSDSPEVQIRPKSQLRRISKHSFHHDLHSEEELLQRKSSPQKPASSAEAQRTEKDRKTLSLHSSFPTPLLYSQEKPSTEVPRFPEEVSGEPAKGRQIKTLWIQERTVVWWSVFTSHPLRQENKAARLLVTFQPGQLLPPSSCRPPAVALQLTLWWCPGQAQPRQRVLDSLWQRRPHGTTRRWSSHRSLSPGATPAAGFLRSVSASPRCCLQEREDAAA